MLPSPPDLRPLPLPRTRARRGAYFFLGREARDGGADDAEARAGDRGPASAAADEAGAAGGAAREPGGEEGGDAVRAVRWAMSLFFLCRIRAAQGFATYTYTYGDVKGGEGKVCVRCAFYVKRRTMCWTRDYFSRQPFRGRRRESKSGTFN